MELPTIVKLIADLLKQWDTFRPTHKHFRPGIGPFGEPQLVRKLLGDLMNQRSHSVRTLRHPDLLMDDEWALEFKIARPYGDNGKVAENWSVNLLHPYEGNTSAIGDAIGLMRMPFQKKAVIVIGYEHEPGSTKRIGLDPLLKSFELIATNVTNLRLGKRIEQVRENLVHPEHQVLRCIAWQIF